jgi:hypothetical protein
MQTQVTPSFEQAEGEVLGGSDTFRKGTAKETPALNELGEQMGYLQQQIASTRQSSNRKRSS